VSRPFEEERLAVRFERGSLEAVAWARMPRRLRDAGLEVDVLVHEYEGMIDDKGLVAGVRSAMPDTRLVGFQHGSLYPPLLCNFVTRGESSFAPLPDRVVCNGEVFRDILVREGLPPEIAVVGPALRYRHLHGDGAAPHSRGRRVLILLPLVRDASTELLHKAVAGLEGVDADVAVKLHPMGSREALLNAAGMTQLPARWDWAKPAMKDALAEADVVVSLGSSSLHEALAAGVPVVGVGREAALDLNPLAWFPDVGELSRTPEVITVEVERLLALSDEELAAYRKRASEILDQSFAGDERPMDVFYGR
jgi:hypothetical protein